MTKEMYEKRFMLLRKEMDKIALLGISSQKDYSEFEIDADIVQQSRLFTLIKYKGWEYNIIQPRRVGKNLIGGFLGISSIQYYGLNSKKQKAYLNEISEFLEGVEPFKYLEENPLHRKFISIKTEFKNPTSNTPGDYTKPGNYRDVEIRKEK